MPFDDSDDDDAPVSGAPLPPDDRLWRHPSELGAAGAATGAVTSRAPLTHPDPSGTRLWAIAVVAGLIGSALSLGVVVAAGGLSSRIVDKPVVEKVAVRPIAELSNDGSDEGAAAITKLVSPSMARVEGTRSNEPIVASGIVLRDDGYVVTNAHVVDQVADLHVTLDGGTALPAMVVGTDSRTDVAVLKITGEKLPVAVLGSATDLQLGDMAVALAAPVGLSGGPSVTKGIVSALGRRATSLGGIELHDMIQTDRPVAEAASGGALCDDAGSVIGMTTAVSSPDDPAASGFGFAIPIDIVRAVADDIISTGAAHHPWLGIEGADLESAGAQTIGIAGGAKVTKVIEESPAAQAGLLNDDVITAVNGVKTVSMSAFIIALRSHRAGAQITLEIVRAGEAQTLTMPVTLGEKHA